MGGAPRQFSLNLKLAWQDEKCNKTKKKTVCSQRPSKRWLDTAELLSCSTVQSNVSGHKLNTITWNTFLFFFLHHCLFCGFKFRFKWMCTDRVCWLSVFSFALIHNLLLKGSWGRYDHKGALTKIFATSCYNILWGCVIFSFLLVPDLLRVKCGLKFAKAFFWCHFVTGLYPVKNRHLI